MSYRNAYRIVKVLKGYMLAEQPSGVFTRKRLIELCPGLFTMAQFKNEAFRGTGIKNGVKFGKKIIYHIDDIVVYLTEKFYNDWTAAEQAIKDNKKADQAETEKAGQKDLP